MHDPQTAIIAAIVMIAFRRFALLSSRVFSGGSGVGRGTRCTRSNLPSAVRSSVLSVVSVALERGASVVEGAPVPSPRSFPARLQV